MRAGVAAGRCLRERVAAVLLPVMVAGTLPLHAGESWDDAGAAAGGDVGTSAGVGDAAPAPPAVPAPAVPPPAARVNRTLPKVTPVPQEPAFSASPSVDEIFRARMASEPLVPLRGAAPSSENVLLAQALTAYVRGRDVEATAPLEAFLEAHPHSAWRASLLTNLGVVYRRVARYTRAIDVQREAWELARGHSDDRGRAVGDKALGELLELHLMFGHQDELERVLGTSLPPPALARPTQAVAPAATALPARSSSRHTQPTSKGALQRPHQVRLDRLSPTPWRTLFATRHRRQPHWLHSGQLATALVAPFADPRVVDARHTVRAVFTLSR